MMNAVDVECSDMNGTHIVTVAALALALIGPASAAGPADAPPGAASCSGCHPATKWVDTTVPRLTGRNPADIIAAMEAFKSGQLPSTVMNRLAKGFSDDEIKAIAAWYGAQKD
jgi:cytochrome c553